MLGIGIGSKTSTGGEVIEGNEGVVFDGLVASLVGHKATCPACKKGIGEIIAVGGRTVQLPAGPAARTGDYVACGCPPGSNTLLAQGSISLSNIHSGSPFSAPNLGGGVKPADKSVDRLYFFYGEGKTPLADSSRFYTDLNLHADTSGYSPGDLIEITVAGITDTSVSGRVSEDGSVFIPGVFTSRSVPLQGDI
ncbi:PAAR domain-containing protein [Halopseudomonas pelagia]|uniref:PAAR domain-containing protein n=1 Tax=Halopseudomonas pelagia TaxID=553151 RepID=A0AA91Z4W3_9GAMM|nr:PAAR domain-containing protein [Halopseudomonas pelagia]PCC98298.1 hypothetical protein CO192_16050 [Halopseudomonas pelagia]QFY56687.1 PAAR domain-containing protein [Halopseudomonas pelagia]